MLVHKRFPIYSTFDQKLPQVYKQDDWIAINVHANNSYCDT